MTTFGIESVVDEAVAVVLPIMVISSSSQSVLEASDPIFQDSGGNSGTKYDRIKSGGAPNELIRSFYSSSFYTFYFQYTMASIPRTIFRAAASGANRSMWASSRTARPIVAHAGPSRVLPMLTPVRWNSSASRPSLPGTSGDAKIKPPTDGRDTLEDESAPIDESSLRIEAPVPGQKSQPIGKIEPRL